MHDYFEILGLSPAADVREIRRASHRRAGTCHPDVEDGERRAPSARGRRQAPAGTPDVAIDFVDMASIVARMRIDFFRTF